jgi:DNA-directed RNA polymerase
MTIVKTTNKGILDELTPETHPIVFDTLNKAQTTGWVVNKDLFPLVNWALRNKVEAFADIWEIQNDEAKRSKLREATAVAGIAKRFVDHVFYH